MMIPPPIPVPSVMRMLSENCFAAPNRASPNAAAFASFVTNVFFPVYFSTRAPSGTSFQWKFDQRTMFPFALSTTPGEPIPIACTSSMLFPAFSAVSMARCARASAVCSAVFAAEVSTRDFPSSFSPASRAAFADIPPRSIPIIIFNPYFLCVPAVIQAGAR